MRWQRKAPVYSLLHNQMEAQHSARVSSPHGRAGLEDLAWLSSFSSLRGSLDIHAHLFGAASWTDNLGRNVVQIILLKRSIWTWPGMEILKLIKTPWMGRKEQGHKNRRLGNLTLVSDRVTGLPAGHLTS